MTNLPLVTIVCTTYNHEPYIAQTLEGFVKQRCNFKFEILVHDDASTDQTADIIQRYANNHPGLFRLVLQKENQYSQGRDIWELLFKDPQTAPYIAICEGDDYWTDQLKLQKQVNILEADPKVGMTYARVKRYYQEKRKCKETFGAAATFNTLISKGNTVPTLTVMLRKELYIQYASDSQSFRGCLKMGDYPMWLWLSVHSNLHFNKEVMGVYRVLSSSASHHTNIAQKKAFEESFNWVRNYFAETYCSDNQHIKDAVNVNSLWSDFIGSMYVQDNIKPFKERIRKFSSFRHKKIFLMNVGIFFPKMFKIIYLFYKKRQG